MNSVVAAGCPRRFRRRQLRVLTDERSDGRDPAGTHRDFYRRCHIPPENKELKWVHTCLYWEKQMCRKRRCNSVTEDLATHLVSCLLRKHHPGEQYLFRAMEPSPEDCGTESQCWSVAVLPGAATWRETRGQSTRWVRSRLGTFAAARYQVPKPTGW
jgi:hypothetical protein